MTVKVPPRGTHGVPFPKFPSPLARLFSRLQARGFRRSRGGHTQGGVDAILLHTVGARSGEPRTALLGYITEMPDSWLVIASLAGAARNPGWLHNLAHDPQATIEFGDGRRVEVRAETLEGADLEAAWTRIAREAPEYKKYESKTDRPIPVIRLRKAAIPPR
ncbi:MAG: nitroreductase family deazaflavin-dependent oxidoreductase [Chloroflexi bacterium]|nr:MAG: nitroreductase family deazaflavin-dependent oxidoreductase [Chloroflexota bacterium]